jgi:hypothetical protein
MKRSSSSSGTWRIGALAKAVGVSTDTLRHYERKGVLRSQRAQELLSMAVETRSVFGKLRDVRKRSLARAHILPIRSGKLMARIACRLFRINVSAMGKLRVIYGALRDLQRRHWRVR